MAQGNDRQSSNSQGNNKPRTDNRRNDSLDKDNRELKYRDHEDKAINSQSTEGQKNKGQAPKMRYGGDSLLIELKPVFYDKEILTLFRRFRRSVCRALGYLESRESRDPAVVALVRSWLEEIITGLEAELAKGKELSLELRELQRRNAVQTLNRNVNEASSGKQGERGMAREKEVSVKENEAYINDWTRNIICPKGTELESVILKYSSQIRFLYLIELTDRVFTLERYATLIGADFGQQGGLWRRRRHNRIVDLCARILSKAQNVRLEAQNSLSR